MALQSLSNGNYKAVVTFPVTAMSTPKRDATNGVLTAEGDLVSLIDQSGNAVGTFANPIFVSGSSSPTTGLLPKGYQQIAATSAAQTLTIPSGTKIAIISIRGNDARYRDDGTAATATVGMPIYMGQAITFTTGLSALSFISIANTTEYNISYYG
jgi:hypothetical protein